VQSEMPLIPEQASNFAPNVDALMLFIVAVCLFFAVAVTAAVIYFFFKYHRKAENEIGVPIHGDMRLETAWIVVPLVLAMFMFAWGAIVYVDYRHTPSEPLDIYVIGKQWMWKVQQPNGLKEINELHVPVGRNVRLVMASEEVIHDFDSGVSREDGRGAGALQHHVVPTDQSGALPFVLLAILRHESRVDGRLGDGDGAVGLRCVALGIGWQRKSADHGREIVHGEGLRDLPLQRRQGPGAFVERGLRRESAAG